jgi:hypothetical protein
VAEEKLETPSKNFMVASRENEYSLSWERGQLLRRMTLQVCLIGKDGFVLASDTRVLGFSPTEMNHSFSTRKIFFNQRKCHDFRFWLVP